ncbi:MAG TPA: anthranilate phosphoribosyltransferase [Acidimicrobiia bacterium]|jgi:anthranilate phosphoribosyltransferase|nr:anthranilate phosphoribosyltransferase [Acidimicrobiia bacterium]
MDWPSLLQHLTGSGDLTRSQAREAMDEIMAGRADPAQVAALVMALRVKGETAEEMTGLVEGLREAAVRVEIEDDGHLVDIVGTGGDRSSTFNISTTAALIAAGAGARVAKHGNRAVSGRCGSADVLEGLGMEIELEPEAMATLVAEEGFGFFYAPRYHPALRHAGPVRKALGIPTIFNFLGPLANPAGVLRYALGVSDQKMAEKMIRVLASLGADTAFVVHGEDGLDEVTTSGPTYILRLKDGEITHAEFTPEDFGVERAPLSELIGGDVDANVEITRSILAGKGGPRRDAAIINAAVGLVAADRAEGFVEGVALATESVDSGAAAEVLERVVSRSRELAA